MITFLLITGAITGAFAYAAWLDWLLTEDDLSNLLPTADRHQGGDES